MNNYKFIGGTGISVPIPRSSQMLHEDMLCGIETGVYQLGEVIEPKTYRKHLMDSSGQIITREFAVSGRKIPLSHLRKKILEKHIKLGIVRESSDIIQQNILLWADHSTLLNSGYLVFTIRVLYCNRIFYTDTEMNEKTNQEWNVQAIVETPELYMICNAEDSLVEKLSYTDTRLEDIKQLKKIIHIENDKVRDVMRFFLGNTLIIS